MKVHNLHFLYREHSSKEYGFTREIHGFIGLIEVHTMACLYGSVHYGSVCPVDTDARQDIGGIAEMVPIPPNHSHVPPTPVPDGILVEYTAYEMAVLRPIYIDEIGNNCRFSCIACLPGYQPPQLSQPTDNPPRVFLNY